MPTTTTNLSLEKPDGSDLAEVAVINDNMDLLDGAFSSSGVGGGGALLAHLRDSPITPSYTGTSAKNMLDLQPTWNTSGTMRGIYLAVTHTAAGAASRAIEVKKSGTTIFDLTMDAHAHLGGTTGTWTTDYALLHIGQRGTLFSHKSNGSGTFLSHNTYFNGTNSKAIVTGASIEISMFDNVLAVYAADSVTADSNQTFATRLLLSAAGELSITPTGGSNALSAGGAVLPSANNTHELGNTSTRWSKLWATNAELSNNLIVGGTITIGSTVQPKITVASSAPGVVSTGDLWIW